MRLVREKLTPWWSNTPSHRVSCVMREQRCQPPPLRVWQTKWLLSLRRRSASCHHVPLRRFWSDVVGLVVVMLRRGGGDLGTAGRLKDRETTSGADEWCSYLLGYLFTSSTWPPIVKGRSVGEHMTSVVPPCRWNGSALGCGTRTGSHTWFWCDDLWGRRVCRSSVCCNFRSLGIARIVTSGGPAGPVRTSLLA